MGTKTYFDVLSFIENTNEYGEVVYTFDLPNKVNHKLSIEVSNGLGNSSTQTLALTFDNISPIITDITNRSTPYQKDSYILKIHNIVNICTVESCKSLAIRFLSVSNASNIAY